MVSNITNTNSFICSQLNSFKKCYLTLFILFVQYSKWLKSCVWPIVGNVTGTTTPGESEPVSNGNERVLHIPQSSHNRSSPSDGLVWYLGLLLVLEGILLLSRDEILDLFPFFCHLSLDSIPFHIHIYIFLSIFSFCETLEKTYFSQLKKFF